MAVQSVTKENLEDADEATFEWTVCTEKWSEDAGADGFDHIAFLFESVCGIEKR